MERITVTIDLQQEGKSMAFQMIHMEVAYRLLSRLPEIEYKAEFILGSVAPDSVHMNPQYEVSRKIISHRFEGCGNWSETQDYERWIQNIRATFYERAGEKSSHRDFVVGLCVHCLTDYWNDRRVWHRLLSENVPPMKAEEFKEAYYPEARGIDQWLYQHSENTKAICKLLSEAEIIALEGLVQKEDMEKIRENLLYVQYAAEAVDITDYRFLSEEFIKEFIDFAVEDIAEKIQSWNGGQAGVEQPDTSKRIWTNFVR